jgi:DNA polymerase bacteriophage-type
MLWAVVIVDITLTASRAACWLGSPMSVGSSTAIGVSMQRTILATGESACRIFGRPSGTFTKASPERKIGKIADLAFGYQGGLNAWRNFMPEGHSDDEVESFKRDWRAAHPAIKKFWRTINNATVLAVQNPGDTAVCGRLELECDGVFLCIKLPSGRRISYPRPTIIDGTYGPSVSFHDNAAGQFKACRNGMGGYGGLWTENAVQGICSRCAGRGDAAHRGRRLSDRFARAR